MASPTDVPVHAFPFSRCSLVSRGMLLSGRLVGPQTSTTMTEQGWLRAPKTPRPTPGFGRPPELPRQPRPQHASALARRSLPPSLPAFALQLPILSQLFRTRAPRTDPPRMAAPSSTAAPAMAPPPPHTPASPAAAPDKGKAVDGKKPPVVVLVIGQSQNLAAPSVRLGRAWC